LGRRIIHRKGVRRVLAHFRFRRDGVAWARRLAKNILPDRGAVRLEDARSARAVRVAPRCARPCP
jgi:hypothetical protein